MECQRRARFYALALWKSLWREQRRRLLAPAECSGSRRPGSLCATCRCRSRRMPRGQRRILSREFCRVDVIFAT